MERVARLMDALRVMQAGAVRFAAHGRLADKCHGPQPSPG